MRILKTFVLLLTLFAFVQEADAQRTRTGTSNNKGQAKELTGNKKFDWGRVFLGGNIGGAGLNLSNGNSNINIQLSPIVGYRITDKFAIGAGPIFNYIKSGGNDGYAIWGTRALARYDILPQFFVSSEISNIRFKCSEIDPVTNEKTKVEIRSLPIGAGYRQRTGRGRSSFVIEFMYDVLYKADGGIASIAERVPKCVSDPGNGFIYRIGFNLGL